MLTDAQRLLLVAVAREAVRAAVTGEPGADGMPVVAAQASGAFVTIKRAGELRGCIGTLQCRASLGIEIARCAVGAALEDPRFLPVQPSELSDLTFELSILAPLERLDPCDPALIEIGRHGLVVRHGRCRGLLLPQVAPEWNWTAPEFLAHTCRKAGLSADAWRRGAEVYRFVADVFGD
ncbi:MAG TPA: AmmeMemoRadiSam system protein A [Vicinamibacterales bacterium]|nr:AmmeMemoRadiSam system protein A [Vicinamibacterales bacterium]